MKKEFMETKLHYETPVVEIVEIMVEQGFAISNEGLIQTEQDW